VHYMQVQYKYMSVSTYGRYRIIMHRLKSTYFKSGSDFTNNKLGNAGMHT